ncbi:hypothetical protein [Haloarcula litorea]|uniref:hypothetical protein n=1 Tax=Haloarcula litorea TaxID=3032579 RepID=UPI0023E8627F|nr:hypothetical protein [Halomicroarcula sp. GDY20]
MSDDASFPAVPTDALDEGGWALADESVETVFKLPTASVVGATRVYDDERTREAAQRAAGVDQQWRFFFATALTFTPPLAPGIGPAMILSTVRSEAESTFADELRDRGFERVERGRRERVRTDSGDRARLRTYSGELALPAADAALSITGWVGVWHGDGFRIAAGAYPDRPVADVLALDDPPTELRRGPRDYREELLALIRAVE